MKIYGFFLEAKIIGPIDLWDLTMYLGKEPILLFGLQIARMRYFVGGKLVNPDNRSNDRYNGDYCGNSYISCHMVIFH